MDNSSCPSHRDRLSYRDYESLGIVRGWDCSAYLPSRWLVGFLEGYHTCSDPSRQPRDPGETLQSGKHSLTLRDQYTSFERMLGLLLAYRSVRRGTASKTLGRSSLSDWDLFMLGAASKLLATGTTYPIVSLTIATKIAS